MQLKEYSEPGPVLSHCHTPFQPLLTAGGRQHFALNVQQHPATEQIAGYVHSYLQVTARKPTPYPIIPDGTQAVFISLQTTRIGGAQTQARDLTIPQAGEYFGIHFYPGALRHFFKLNLAEITNQFVEGRYLPCRYFPQLHEQIYQQSEFVQRVRICEKK